VRDEKVYLVGFFLRSGAVTGDIHNDEIIRSGQMS
jgi:hypothetical protein